MTEIASPTPYLRAWREGFTGFLLLNRPERRNALNREMWAALPALVKTLDDDPETRLLVVKGAGVEAFAAGADISEFADTRSSPERVKDYEALNGAAFAALRATSKPAVAMIQGFCIGGGLALALACDLRIASLGLRPAAGKAWSCLSTGLPARSPPGRVSGFRQGHAVHSAALYG